MYDTPQDCIFYQKMDYAKHFVFVMLETNKHKLNTKRRMFKEYISK